ncbi:MAG: choice-of-anchor D domain-containing protein [Gammaproteobacteria bacterium]|nr:choice-of-anchor D domain-containing protein [Gammaproteobacteria bacterium]
MNRLTVIAACTLAAVDASSTPIPPFLVNPLAFDFGNVATGDSGVAQRVTITNVTMTDQTLSLAGGAAGVFGGSSNCVGATLAPGASCFVQYNFSPTALGSASRTTTLGLNGENYQFDFMGFGISPFSVTPTAMDFGDVNVGSSSAAQQVIVTNTSNASQTLTLSGGAAGVFGGSSNCIGATLAAGSSCFVSYAFTPATSGATTRTTTLGLNDETHTFTLSGVGGASGSPFLVTARGFDFGTVALGEPSEGQRVEIKNVSSVDQIVSLSGGAAGVFGGSSNCVGMTLAPGASCFVEYRFTPADLGTTTRTTTLGINGENYQFSFKGEGILPFRLSPYSFDFGAVELGTTSAMQAVRLYNTSNIERSFSIAGGAAGVFSGSSNCIGMIVVPDDFCSIFYAFTPTDLDLVERATSISIDGINRQIFFRGFGAEEGSVVTPPPGTVPEPATWLSIILGLGLMGNVSRRTNDSRSA